MNAKICKSILCFSRHAAFAAAIYCGAALATSATAQERGAEPLTKVVSYADLNVSSSAGVRVLYGRLRMAATQVCAPFKGGTLKQKEIWADCFDQAIARSVRQVDQTALTTYHLSRTGKTETTQQVAKDQ